MPISFDPPPNGFADLLNRLYTAQYTGQVTLHFLHGTPKLVETPTLARVAIPVDGRGKAA